MGQGLGFGKVSKPLNFKKSLKFLMALNSLKSLNFKWAKVWAN